MALGDQAGLQAVQTFLAGAPAIVDKLLTAGHSDEAELIQALHGFLKDAGSIAQPFADQLKRLADVAESFRAFSRGFDISVAPKSAASTGDNESSPASA